MLSQRLALQSSTSVEAGILFACPTEDQIPSPKGPKMFTGLAELPRSYTLVIPSKQLLKCNKVSLSDELLDSEKTQPCSIKIFT